MSGRSTRGYRNRPLISGKGSNGSRKARSNSVMTSGEMRERGGFPVYLRPESIEEAVSLLSRYGEGLKPLAGGTDLLVQYYDRLFEVQGWLDLSKITGLGEIKLFKERIEIGAMVTHNQLEKSTLIRRWLPVLGLAAAGVGSPQIRSRGTIGGNIGTASPAGDLLGPLLAYDARFELVSGQGTGLIPAAEFFLGPKKTVLAVDQLIKKVVIPLPDQDCYGSWIKIGRRKALTISTISLALILRLNREGKISSFRACFGAAAPTPLIPEGLQRYALGKRPVELDLSRLGEIAAGGIAPIDDLRGTERYRRITASSMITRAVREVITKTAGLRGGGE